MVLRGGQVYEVAGRMEEITLITKDSEDLGTI